MKFFDDEWQQDTGPKWRKRYTEITEAKAKLTLLEDAPTEASTIRSCGRRCCCCSRSTTRSRRWKRSKCCCHVPANIPKAHLLMGRMLLDRADDRGLKHLLLAVEQDLELTDEAGRAGYVYLMRRGREKEAKRFWTKAQELYENPRPHAGFARRSKQNAGSRGSMNRRWTICSHQRGQLLAHCQLLRVRKSRACFSASSFARP